jgi:peptide/nickel transport system permease protein
VIDTDWPSVPGSDSSDADAPQKRRGRQAWRSKPGLVIGGGLVGGWVLITAFAPLLARYSPTQPVGKPLQPPSSQFYFGTDNLGYDVFSRVLYAPRNDLVLACGATLIALAAGWLTGATIGMSRRLWADAVMRFVDAIQAFPLLVLALALVAALGQSRWAIVGSIAFINFPIFLRLVRSQVLSLRELRFIEAAVADGNPRWRVVLRHVLPNTTGPVLAQASVSMATAVIVIAALSYLSLGLKPPTPEWGQMIQAGATYVLSGQWWLVVFPGLAVASLACGLMLLGDGLQGLLQTGRRG